MNAIAKPAGANMHPDEWRERVRLAAGDRVVAYHDGVDREYRA